jgi:Rod binding domain-containing protein
MDALRIETMSMAPRRAGQQRDERAIEVAGQFESIFVRTLVSSLRQTSSIAGGSMFGEGPGTDTYSDWFDQNLAEQIGKTSEIGIATQLKRDFARAHAMSADASLDDATLKARTAAKAAATKASSFPDSKIPGGTDAAP